MGEAKGQVRHGARSRSTSVAQLSRWIVDVAGRLLGAGRGTIALLDEADVARLRDAARQPGFRSVQITLTRGSAGRRARAQLLVRIDTDAHEPALSRRFERGDCVVSRTALTAPIHGTDGRLFGIARVRNIHGRSFVESDASVMEFLAGLIGRLIEETIGATEPATERRERPYSGEPLTGPR
jgi:GAF domain-containing protein